MSLKNILFYNLDKVYKFMTASEKPILFFVNPKSGQGKSTFKRLFFGPYAKHDHGPIRFLKGPQGTTHSEVSKI